MTVTINKQEELEALIDENNNIIIDDDLKINCNINIEANIKAKNIKAWNIEAYNIDALNIIAGDIKTVNNIIADNIEAEHINYHAFCITYESLKCKTIKGERKKSLHACIDKPIRYIPFHACIDKPIKYIPSRPTIPSTNIILKDGI